PRHPRMNARTRGARSSRISTEPTLLKKLTGFVVLVVLADASDARIRSRWVARHALGVDGQGILACPVLEQNVLFWLQRAAEDFELQATWLLLRLLAAFDDGVNRLVGSVGAVGGELDDQTHSTHWLLLTT